MSLKLNKIIVTGPESTGKTTLSQELSAHYNCAWVPEYARQYLAETNGRYEFADLEQISQGQAEWQASFVNQSPQQLIMDTGQEVLYIWSMFKYDKVDPKITKRLEEQGGSFHLLCKPDILWEPDPLRENEKDRDILFEKYEDLLHKYDLPYGVVEGQGGQRLNSAILFIEKFIR